VETLQEMGGRMKDLVVILICMGLALGSIAGWITHIVTCFTHDMWGFLIAGALFFPIGIIHGFGLMCGWW
jgi:hypothetical protein